MIGLKYTKISEKEAKAADRTTSLHKQVGLRGLVGGLELPGWWSHLTENQWELDLAIVKLFGALPLAKFGRNSRSLDDLDAREPHTVSGRHLGVHLLNGTVQGGVTELLVHVVVPSPALVPQPDSKVLDRCRVLLKDLQTKPNII